MVANSTCTGYIKSFMPGYYPCCVTHKVLHLHDVSLLAKKLNYVLVSGTNVFKYV